MPILNACTPESTPWPFTLNRFENAVGLNAPILPVRGMQQISEKLRTDYPMTVGSQPCTQQRYPPCATLMIVPSHGDNQLEVLAMPS